MTELITRSFPVEDMTIVRGGDGRTVEAYAAVFDQGAAVRDQWGVYEEKISRSAFNKAISDAAPQGGRTVWRMGVFYNHGLTIHGTASDRGSVPIGTPVEVTADSRGVKTVTRYNKTPLADEVLEGIASGSITAQSFTGAVRRSDKPMPRGGFRPNADGSLQVVTRMEMGLKEYGPTPFPVYEGAAITAVRADLSDGERTMMSFLLAQLAASDAALDPIVAAICAADGALDAAQAAIAQILMVPNPDPVDGEPADTEVAASDNLTSFARRLDAALAARASGTSSEAASDEPRIAHSGRLIVAHNNLRAALTERGIRP
jgi:HK97 family phage prohead protease